MYLCLNSTEIFNETTAAKELENVSVATIDNYIEALVMSNLLYLSKPMNVGSKGALKGKPQIYIADAAIRNAVLMIDDVLADEKELGVMVETAVYKHIVSFYQGSTASVEYFRKAKNNLDDFGLAKHETSVRVKTVQAAVSRENDNFMS